jgi:copper chaperone NosL
MKPALLALTAALVTAACVSTADGPPEILVDRTACSHCGMLISEPVYAAAYGAAGSASRMFDDIGCLMNAVGREGGSAGRYWFHDAAGGTWIEGGAAVFVASSGIRTPMGGGVIAYRDRAAAERAAQRHGGIVIGTLAELLSGSGGRS